MLEKYEKPKLLSQKMELNVLRATCQNKDINSEAGSQPAELGCSDPGTACDGCTITTPEMS
jgi:hypothetical protein